MIPALTARRPRLVAAEPLEHDPERLHEVARELLSRPPYTESAPGPMTDILLRVRDWLAQVLDAVLGAVSGSAAFAWTVVLVATIVLIVLVVRWSRSLSVDLGEAGHAVTGASRSAADWRDEADRHARAQQWAEAVRAAYGAVVAGLVEDGMLDDAGGLTVGEIDRQTGDADPTRAEVVRRAGRAFEDVWYGHRPADRQQFARVVAAWPERVGAAR